MNFHVLRENSNTAAKVYDSLYLAECCVCFLMREDTNKSSPTDRPINNVQYTDNEDNIWDYRCITLEEA